MPLPEVENRSFVMLDGSVAYRIRRLARLLRVELNQVLANEPGNLTAEQWVILLKVHETGEVYQHELNDAVLRDRANITRHLNKLESYNYIGRIPDEEDARRNLVILTEDGAELIDHLIPIINELRIQRYQGLSEDEITQLLHFIDVIEGNLRASISDE